MPTAAEHRHTWDTRCDACGQASVTQATRGGRRLQLCGHHERVCKTALEAAGFIVGAAVREAVDA